MMIGTWFPLNADFQSPDGVLGVFYRGEASVWKRKVGLMYPQWWLTVWTQDFTMIAVFVAAFLPQIVQFDRTIMEVIGSYSGPSKHQKCWYSSPDPLPCHSLWALDSLSLSQSLLWYCLLWELDMCVVHLVSNEWNSGGICSRNRSQRWSREMKKLGLHSQESEYINSILVFILINLIFTWLFEITQYRLMKESFAWQKKVIQHNVKGPEKLWRNKMKTIDIAVKLPIFPQ